MQNSKVTVLILKPQINFLSFIESELPDFDVDFSVDLEMSAYSFDSVTTDAGLIEKLEKIYPQILHIELNKILGSKLSRNIQGTFFDFLNCFKFEVIEEQDASLFADDGKTISFIPKNVTFDVSKDDDLCIQDVCAIIEKNKLLDKIALSVYHLDDSFYEKIAINSVNLQTYKVIFCEFVNYVNNFYKNLRLAWNFHI